MIHRHVYCLWAKGQNSTWKCNFIFAIYQRTAFTPPSHGLLPLQFAHSCATFMLLMNVGHNGFTRYTEAIIINDTVLTDSLFYWSYASSLSSDNLEPTHVWAFDKHTT